MSDPPTTETIGPPLLSAARVEDVFAATEEVRAADFPNVPAQLLADVLAAERDNPDNRAAGARAVSRVVDAHLTNAPAPASGPTGRSTDEGQAHEA